MNIYYKYDINSELYRSNNFNINKYDDIVYLSCYSNNLINLPILPISLIKLYCSYNKLNYLPILLNCLYILFCSNNNIINLLNINNKIYNLNYDKDKIKFISKLLYK